MREALGYVDPDLGYWDWLAVLMGLHVALLANGANVHSPTLNEPGHLAAGISNWQFGRFDVYKG